MVFDPSVLAAELAGKGAGADVALRADFQGNAAVSEEIHQCRVLRCGDAVADSFGSEKFDGFANFFGATDFAGVHQAMQADFTGFVVDTTEISCGDG